jgi:hypothetical protein
MNFRIFLYLFPFVLLFISSCSNKNLHAFKATYKDANSLVHGTEAVKNKPFLKAHMHNGDVHILNDEWKIDTTTNVIIGMGSSFNANRSKKYEGVLKIKISDVSLFETNTKLETKEEGRILATTLLLVFEGAMAIVCFSNPKACFGSCPTFYLNEDDNFHYADAEGFTNAILPSMEYHDIDALTHKKLSGSTFKITLKNEALESHFLNDVKVLAHPLQPGQRVYHTQTDSFYLCDNLHELILAKGNEGEITMILKEEDKIERFSLSDEEDLNSKEEIYLTYDCSKSTSENLGLIVDYRQTLMTTFLFYNAMGYMGDMASDIFARMEKEPELRENFDATTKLLGGIDVFIWDEKMDQWVFNQSLTETGPIAINRQFIPLKNVDLGSELKVKLVLNKGLWRIDYVGLTDIVSNVSPQPLVLHSIYNKGIIDTDAYNKIMDPSQYLISMPGSEFALNFDLPIADTEYELFLYSKGYYLEWQREEWLKDKNLIKLKQMVDMPGWFLRGEAKKYKEYETHMEQEFWNSKVNTKLFSYYEK